jgi:hypothetical protein
VYLTAANSGTLFDKPNFDSPYPPTHFTWHQPIKDRLQSSYADVEYEMDHIRRSPQHKFSHAVNLGGDGLSYMRLIHKLAQDPEKYLRRTPVVIPRLGEHPHGTYHVLHGDWRLWWPFLEAAAKQVNNRQIRPDPTVSEFNEAEHFLRIVTRACAEYVVEISKTGCHYHATSQFLTAADANLSFLIVCNFLYLFGFKFLQMRNAVRTNDSPLLDLIWAENLASARASNKHQYSVMSVVCVYWGAALVEPLASAFHNLRTIRYVHSHVGWDMPIEMLNKLVKESVVANITHELIAKFIRRLNFTHIVHRALSAVVHAGRQHDEATLKDIDTDVGILKEWLRECIGTTYAEATSASEDNLLNLDLTEWGGGRGRPGPAGHGPRNVNPWRKRALAMSGEHDYHKYVQDTVGRLCPWHIWQ